MIYLYCTMMTGVIGFQIALILGAPWGRLTQGGQVEGPLPPVGRLVAAVSIIILAAFALAMLSADGRWPYWPRWTGWVTVSANALMMVLNWITPSPAERRIWGPITTTIFILALAIQWP